MSDRTPESPRLLLAEDDPDVRETTRLVLERRGFAVITASDGLEALRLAGEHPLDLAVVDIAMPRMDGLALTRQLAAQGLPVVLLTARGLNSDVVGGLESGADDYVTKPFDGDVLAARIRTVLRRRLPTVPEADGPEMLDGVRVSRSAMTVHRDDEPISLSPTEFKVLIVLLDHRGSALSREQIVSHVWGVDGWQYARAVDTNIQRLRKKLSAESIQTVRGIGYRIDA